MNPHKNITTKQSLTQCEKVLAFMRAKGGITPIDALSEFGCFSLAQRVYDLKKRGFSIITERVTRPGMFGTVNFAKYHLVDKGGEND